MAEIVPFSKQARQQALAADAEATRWNLAKERVEVAIRQMYKLRSAGIARTEVQLIHSTVDLDYGVVRIL